MSVYGIYSFYTTLLFFFFNVGDHTPADTVLTSTAFKSFPPFYDNYNNKYNYFFGAKKCGIGWHGDSERKKVVGLRIGGSMVLKFRWFHKHKGVGKSFEVMLNDGDMYIMSEKSVGYDWKKSSIFTLRHSAGCNKYVKDK